MAENHKKRKITFGQFLEFFPEIDLPITLSEENALVFSRENDPLPPEVIENYLQPWEQSAPDEFTEYVPCARIPETHDFHALIFWRAGLMDYQYVMFTYSKDGSQLIDRKTLAGTYSDGQALIRSVANIDDEWMVHVVTGKTSSGEQTEYDASSSVATNFELLPDGRIISV